MIKKKYNKGFTLLEVMIAVVVFSFGLIGIAGVMTVSVKNNHNGYMRSQAAFLATSMIDLMRENQVGLWSTNYDGVYSGYTALNSGNNCTTTACTSVQLAARDVIFWSNMLDQILPNSSGQISCISPGPASTPVPIMVVNPTNPPNLMPCENCAIDPYNGFCTVTVNWTESNDKSSNWAQTFVLVGKP